MGNFNNVSEDVNGEFQWSNPYWEIPDVHKIKENAGDNLHIVEPRTQPLYQVNKTSYGTKLWNTGGVEHVFMADRFQSVEQDDLTFLGRTAYACKDMLAIFEGTSLHYQDFALELTGQVFGASLKILGDENIRGRIAGNGSGDIIITLPNYMSTDNRNIYINGKKVRHRTKGQKIIFKCEANIKDGYYSTYDIITGHDSPTPAPEHPELYIKE